MTTVNNKLKVWSKKIQNDIDEQIDKFSVIRNFRITEKGDKNYNVS